MDARRARTSGDGALDTAAPGAREAAAAAAAAAEATERLHSIARSVPYVLFQYRESAEGRSGDRFLFVSERSAGVLGLTPEELQRDPERLRAMIHPEDREAARPGAPDVNGDVINEYRIVRPEGTVRWLRVITRSLVEPDGSRLWHGSMDDVTERRALEHVREQASVATAANLAKTQFLARMSHELRTPLNAVLGFAQLMEIDRHEPPAPGQAKRLRLIREAGEHLLRMISDLLDMTRIESGGMTLKPEPVDLRAFAAQLGEMMDDELAKASVSLEVSAPDDGRPLELEADRTRLRQVLLNLMSNAIKYNRPGGRVTLGVRREGADGALFEVADNGQGIAPEDLPHVFEPFHRGRQASGPVEGTGIGLAVTQAIVSRMGGRIEAESSPGAGSAFRVWLPRVQPPSS